MWRCAFWGRILQILPSRAPGACSGRAYARESSRTGSWVSLCFFPAPSGVGLLFLRQLSISTKLVGSYWWRRTEDGGAGVSPRLTKPHLCHLHQCPSQQLGAGGLPASPAREEGAAGGSGQQTVSSFHAGALTCIEVLPGPTVLGVLGLFFPLVSFFFFFP